MRRILKASKTLGGKCQHCHEPMGSGLPIFKVNDGKVRRWQNPTDGGPGSWVCEVCAWRYLGQLSLFEMAEVAG